MSFFVPPRVDVPELLDEPDAPRADVERSLVDLRRFNRWLGGNRAYRQLLDRFDGGEALVVLDLGTGSSDLLGSVEGARLRVGLDLQIAHLLFDRGSAPICRVVADARALPFRDSAVDVVTSALFFHHFDSEENAAILRESLRVARRGVAVNDIERHRLPLAFVWLLGTLRLVGRITRFDAIASFRRAYTAEEAHGIAERSGAARFEIVEMFLYRFGVLLTK